MTPAKTRIAPSPTWFVHIGTLRTALWDYMIAKKAGGIFTLRLEDTDQSRYVEGSYDNLAKVLARFGLVPDEWPLPFPDLGNGPYAQSERLDIYKKEIQTLLENGSAYPCFCSADRLENLRKEQEAAGLPTRYDGHCRHIDPDEARRRMDAGEPHTIRLRVERGETLVFHDAIRGRVEFSTNEVDDQILIKSDGFPTYHFAVIVDDHLMGVTHVLRGEEWLPSTPKQILVARALGIELPEYAHVPLILGPDRKKLSKRTGDTAVEQYLAAGYLEEALINYIAFLGWNPKTTEEIFSLEALTEKFDLADVQRAGAVFDRTKLDWMNGEYIKALSVQDLYDRLSAYLQEYQRDFYEQTFSKKSPEYTRSILKELSTRMKRLEEYPGLTPFFYGEPEISSVDMFLNAKMKVSSIDDVRSALEMGIEIINNSTQSESLEQFKERFLSHIAEAGRKNGQVLWPVRVALSGAEHSPGAFELAAILWETESLTRLKRALAFLSGMQ